VMELLELGWRWYDHIFASLFPSIVVVVMVVVMNVTEVRINETVGLNLSLRLIVEMAMDPLKVTAMALGLGPMIHILLLILLTLLFLLRPWWLNRLFHIEHGSLMVLFQWIFHIDHNIMEWLLLTREFRRRINLWRIRKLLSLHGWLIQLLLLLSLFCGLHLLLF
jgi:hypothetical protein